MPSFDIVSRVDMAEVDNAVKRHRAGGPAAVRPQGDPGPG